MAARVDRSPHGALPVGIVSSPARGDNVQLTICGTARLGETAAIPQLQGGHPLDILSQSLIFRYVSTGHSNGITSSPNELVGGQKQRISLARALAIKPSILILDDTTSAVDLETERQIQDSLEHLDFTCTKIIIAQRISTTKNADKILVLQDGKILESGTHRELVERGGYYAQVVKLQTGEEL